MRRIVALSGLLILGGCNVETTSVIGAQIAACRDIKGFPKSEWKYISTDVGWQQVIVCEVPCK